MGDGDGEIVIKRRRPRWWRYFGIAAALALAVFAVGRFARWSVDHASERWHDCANTLFETGDGDARACAQSGWLVLPKLVPWTRADARQLASDIAGSVASDSLTIATVRDLDRTARDRAATELIAASSSEPFPDSFYSPGGRLHRLGALDALVAHGAELKSASELDLALTTAIELGDSAALKRLAAVPVPSGGVSWEAELSIGAVKCALGDKAGGLAALGRAEVGFHNGNPTLNYREAEFAELACDPTRTVHLENYDDSLVGYVRAIAGGPAVPPRDEQLYGEGARLGGLELAHQVGGTRAANYLPYIAQYGQLTLAPTPGWHTPWALLNAALDQPRAPAWADATATKLIELASAAKPVAKAHADDLDDPVAADPATYLRWAALVLELDAATGWARRGDVARSKAAANQAVALARDPGLVKLVPDAPDLLVSALEVADDWAGAEQVLDVEGVAQADNVGLRAIQRSLVLAHRGKLAEASAALDPALTASLDTTSTQLVRWLRAAFALGSNQQRGFTLPRAPIKITPSVESPAVLAYWIAAATGDATTQRHMRWASYNEDGDTFNLEPVLPAMFYVVGRAAGNGDVELWLDAYTQAIIADPQALASARAEAARWRGDSAAAKRWDDRLAAQRALVHDDTSAFLLHLALHP